MRAIWGDSAVTLARRSEGTAVLLAEGKAGIERWIGGSIAAVPDGHSTDALVGLASYLANHPTHLGCAGRLSCGRSIGSGQVEGRSRSWGTYA